MGEKTTMLLAVAVLAVGGFVLLLPRRASSSPGAIVDPCQGKRAKDIVGSWISDGLSLASQAGAALGTGGATAGNVDAGNALEGGGPAIRAITGLFNDCAKEDFNKFGDKFKDKVTRPLKTNACKRGCEAADKPRRLAANLAFTKKRRAQMHRSAKRKLDACRAACG